MYEINLNSQKLLLRQQPSAERVEPTLSEPAQSEEKGTKELEQASQAQTVQTQVPVEKYASRSRRS